ncbi:hypothetical protein [Ohtaekwangia koreensis]|uniref:Outer membrane protein beta-barrel domain-containing protein n=1 Tax=Ohtaekwangia koreensis TaxID=688867 RepID=A0A1T5LHX5_9BACT|nr:hypothetical protein [Ohtaekwangia koreensis]SKC75622.1 hypothetical protein SAMN05660236_3281 [Ohtaekwangia koreensis]
MQKFLLPVFFIILVSSCAPIYVPNLRNSPMFTKGGEFQGSMQVGNGLDLQGAVSVTNHIGLMGNYSFSDRGKIDPDDTDNYHRHSFFEGGLGYYENDGIWCYEIFAGYGRGDASSYDEYDIFGSGSTDSWTTGKYERWFVQPAFGINKKVMGVSFVPRFSVVDFYEFKDEITGVTISDVNASPKVFVEPAVIGRVNLANNHVFFTFQAGVTIAASPDVYFEYRTFQLGTGIGFRFGGSASSKSNESSQN